MQQDITIIVIGSSIPHTGIVEYYSSTQVRQSSEFST